MILRAVIFDLGGTLIHFQQSSDVLTRLGNQAVADYLRSKGFPFEPNEVELVSGEICEAYMSFAEKSLIEIGAKP